MRITPPTIGKLLGISRQMAHRRVIAGDFGAVHRRGTAHEVELVAVEAVAGVTFAAGQLAAAGIYVPHDEGVA